jgi:hypothetical protein
MLLLLKNLMQRYIGLANAFLRRVTFLKVTFVSLCMSKKQELGSYVTSIDIECCSHDSKFNRSFRPHEQPKSGIYFDEDLFGNISILSRQ